MRTTTAIPTEMKVLMNHIYELHKGVRHMVLFTCNKKYSELAIQRLESQGIPYLLQPAGQQNLNVYFGQCECLEAIRLIVTRPLLWGGVDDNEIARRVLSWIPDDFKGKLLDIPVGTAVFTTEKYRRMKQADITCLDYSQDMLEQAEYRFRGAGITNIKTMQGDVGTLPFEEGSFDIVLCMNGLHVFPNKDKAYSEILRILKSGGELLACFYIAGEQRVADWLAKTVMTRMGWFTPPFDTANDVRKRLGPYYDILDFHVEGAMLYFRAKKR